MADVRDQRRMAAARALLRIANLSSVSQMGVIALLGGWFGLALSSYAMFLPRHPGQVLGGQTFAAMVKVPVVLLATLLVGYWIALLLNMVLRTRIAAHPLWRLWLRVMLLMSWFLLVLSPVALVIGLFHNYALCVLSSYGLFALAGAAAALHLLGELRMRSRHGGHYAPGTSRFLVLWGLWTLAFACTGLTLGWIVRPFIGYAGQPFTWFRVEHASVFEQIYHEWHNLLGH